MSTAFTQRCASLCIMPHILLLFRVRGLLCASPDVGAPALYVAVTNVRRIAVSRGGRLHIAVRTQESWAPPSRWLIPFGIDHANACKTRYIVAYRAVVPVREPNCEHICEHQASAATGRRRSRLRVSLRNALGQTTRCVIQVALHVSAHSKSLESK